MIRKAKGIIKDIKAKKESDDCLNLSIDRIELSHEELKELLPYIQERKNIVKLGLQQNYLEDQSVEMFSGLQLISLDLAFNWLTGNCIQYLKKMTTLKCLHLEFNEDIDCKSIKGLIEALPDLELITFSCDCGEDHGEIKNMERLNDNLSVYQNSNLIRGNKKDNPSRYAKFV
jgi:hypothetical protein